MASSADEVKDLPLGAQAESSAAQTVHNNTLLFIYLFISPSEGRDIEIFLPISLYYIISVCLIFYYGVQSPLTDEVPELFTVLPCKYTESFSPGLLL